MTGHIDEGDPHFALKLVQGDKGKVSWGRDFVSFFYVFFFPKRFYGRGCEDQMGFRCGEMIVEREDLVERKRLIENLSFAVLRETSTGVFLL